MTRHPIDWNDLQGQIPLGNGEFCFNADATGLQTFGRNTMAHWGWHSVPLPSGCAPADLPPTGTMERGRITGSMRKAAERGELDGWMFRNPHPMNLGRLRWVRSTGTALEGKNISEVTRRYDLWTGMHTSRFEVDRQPVTLETCVHPTLDLIAVRAESTLLRDGQLVVALEFPYPSANHSSPWAGDWNRPEAHSSDLVRREGEDHAEIRRTADASSYYASVAWSAGCALREWPGAAGGKHGFLLSGGKDGQFDYHLAPIMPPVNKGSRATRFSTWLTGAGVWTKPSFEEAGGKNRYDDRGVNTGGPCPYLPGNGGLLYAVAMMAAGWDGAPTNHAPGFPSDGTWNVRWEGLKRAP